MSDSLGRRAVPAMTAFFISTLLGFLTGLGIGGGSLLILWLTQVQGIDQSTARLINLIFFLPGALCATAFRLRRGEIPFRKLLPAIAAGCAAAWCGARLSGIMNTELLKKLFGALLLAVGFREITWKERKQP